MKFRRTRWTGHMISTWKHRNVYRVLVEKQAILKAQTKMGG